MPRYIDADALYNRLFFKWKSDRTGGKESGLRSAMAQIQKAPTADVAPVVHGRWITYENGVTVCSNCGEEHEWDEYRATYCEDCGAKMDLKEGDSGDC